MIFLIRMRMRMRMRIRIKIRMTNDILLCSGADSEEVPEQALRCARDEDDSNDDSL